MKAKFTLLQNKKRAVFAFKGGKGSGFIGHAGGIGGPGNPGGSQSNGEGGGKGINSEAFKKWFGNSKVVDANGNPLRVYHGTPMRGDIIEETTPERTAFNESMDKKYGTKWHSGMLNQDEMHTFLNLPDARKYVPTGAHLEGNAFDPNRATDIGIHFGTKEQASQFSKSGAIYPVYLKIENMVRIPDIFSRGGEYISAVRSLDAEHILKNSTIYKLEALASNLETIYNSLDDPRDIGAHPKNIAFWKSVRKAIKHNIDGFIYSNDIEGSGDSYVVFNSNQIKSAIGNIGTYDPNNPDITKQAIFHIKHINTKSIEGIP